MTATAAAERAGTLAQLASRPFDLLIVGGGATGAATARDAARRGLDVALVEAADFASGTSSGSSKLIHGGLRYLQYGDFHLVFEGLTERASLMRIAPHLCRAVEFLFPGYKDERPGLATLGAGIALYNALARWRPPAASRRLRARELLELHPHLRAGGLRGAQAYVDCQTDDARLVLAHALDAAAAGALVASHVRAGTLLRDRRGRVHGVVLLDTETGARFEARAEVIVIAAGPFADDVATGAGALTPRLRPTLGVHLVFDAARLPHGGRVLVLRSPRDNRLFFVMPAGARTIVGTTDTDWVPDGQAPRPPRLDDRIRARGHDVRYLLEAVGHGFPSLALGPADVVSTYAALRPLLATNANTPSETSREHEIIRGPAGVLTVVGGKLTTLRRMGEETVDAVIRKLHAAGFEGPLAPCATAITPLPGGDRADRIAALAATDPTLAERIVPDLPYVWAEVVHAARQESARDVSDVLCRRIPLFREARDQGLAAADRTAAILAAELGWTDRHRAASLEDYRLAIDASRAWMAEI
jgi:glycerol-3-phosphate dehydrogenase